MTKEIQESKFFTIVQNVKAKALADGEPEALLTYLCQELVADLDKTIAGAGEWTLDLERRELQEKVSFLESHDILTELPNRRVFTRKLKENLAKRRQGPVAVLVVDIDRFKYINDRYGHDIGDTLLIKVAERIKDLLTEEDLICRFGGNEFAVLVNSGEDIDKIHDIACNIINKCSQRFLVKGHELFVTVSIGMAIYPDIGRDAGSLLKHADMAMFAAKKNGGNRFQLNVSEKDQQPFKSYALLGKLNNALQNQEFLLYYQPQLELRSGRIRGAEALIRWFSPQGLIKPADFIPLAEDTGLIIPLGEWMIKTACQQNQLWQLQGLKNLKLSVNISAKQFYHPDFVSGLERTLAETRLDPKLLTIEITESIAMINFEYAAKIIQELSEIGLTMAIDDFGTGYSSLNYLANMELDYLKLDKSLIENLHVQGKKGSVVKGVIHIAHNLGIKVIAEGVENREELEFLRQHRCDLVQGFLIGHPLPPEEAVRSFHCRFDPDN